MWNLTEAEVAAYYLPIIEILEEAVSSYGMVLTYGGTSKNVHDEPRCLLNWSNLRGLTCQMSIVPIIDRVRYRASTSCWSSLRSEGTKQWDFDITSGLDDARSVLRRAKEWADGV